MQSQDEMREVMVEAKAKDCPNIFDAAKNKLHHSHSYKHLAYKETSALGLLNNVY